MANLSIRKLNEKAYAQLRIRAATHGISMEEEARQIIYQAVSAPEQISNVFRKYFGEGKRAELKLPNRQKPHKPLDSNK